MSNKEPKYEVESETSKQKRERPSKNAEKEKKWIDEETFKLIDFWLISLLARTVQNELETSVEVRGF